MTDERTAVDVLLAIEQKQDQILRKQNSIDLIEKINSNKLKQVEDKIDHIIGLINEVPGEFDQSSDMNPFNIATAPPMKIQEEFAPVMPITTDAEPVGFRRTSRPESYSNPRTAKKNVPTPSIPLPEMKPAKSIEQPPVSPGMKYPLEQRIVDKNSKAIFKADVEVVDSNGTTISKTQTGVMGKWSATLAPGKYRVHISKFDSSSNKKMSVAQDLTVDGKTPKELPMMIIR